MPRLEDNIEDSLVGYATRWYKRFENFCLRDNVLEVAVGLIIAAAFTSIANSLVTDIILPIISLLPFLSRNFEEKFVILRPGPNPDDTIKQGYNTVKQALEDGAIVWAWGLFVEKLLHFVTIAISLFLIANFYGWVTKDDIIKKQVKCRYCRKWISEKAKRCVNCTSWVDGREDKDQPQ